MGMRTTLLVTVVCLFVVGMASAALAGSSGPFTSNIVGYQATDWNGLNLVLPKFNSSLGVLDEVQLYLSSGIKTNLTVVNTGDANSTGDAYTEVKFNVTDPLALVSLETDLYSPLYHFENLVPNSPQGSGELTKAGSDYKTFTDAATLAEFNGPGTISLPVSTVTKAWIGYTGGNAAADQTTTAQAYARVNYVYHVVPEPSSLVGLFAGAFGLIGFARRRK